MAHTRTQEMRVLSLFLLALLFSSGTATGAQEEDPVEYDYEVVAAYPHDADAFTQGLECAAPGCAVLLESTGQYGRSSVRRVATATGAVLAATPLPADLFGEGLAQHAGALYQTTWRERVLSRYDARTLRLVARAPYTVAAEGWGLTHDGAGHLVASDGSSTLHVFAVGPPPALAQRVVRRVPVRLRGRALPRLNELEHARGRVWANVWFADTLVAIDPATGTVVGTADLAGLRARPDCGAPPRDVLNGIAYDAAADEFLVTGKNWPVLYRIRLHPRPRPGNSEL